jgi:hypothetical protein
MIPRFFKDMPPKEKRNEIGKYRIEVRTIFPMRESVVYSEVYEGKLWKAYVKVRIKAFIKDLATNGEHYGIGWAIKKG